MAKSKGCLSQQTLFIMTEQHDSRGRFAEAFRHLDGCESCRARYRSLEETEYRLRLGAMSFQDIVTEIDVERTVAASLLRVCSLPNHSQLLEQGKENLLQALAPLCGERLSQRSIELASTHLMQQELISFEEEWNAFVTSLGDILYSVCGASVKQAVRELSEEALIGAA